jgi:hypothetical protein
MTDSRLDLMLLDDSEEPPAAGGELAHEAVGGEAIELALPTAPPPRPPIPISPPPASWPAISRPLDLVEGPLAMALAGPISLLPERWRQQLGGNLPLVPATIVTALIEIVAAVFMGSHSYPPFADACLQEAARVGDDGVLFALKAATWVAFLISPTGLLLLFLLVEGLVRAAGAASTGEPVGTVPLWILQRAQGAIRERARGWRAGPLIEDRVFRDSDEKLVRIESCRPRPWDQLVTIVFEDHLYAVVRSQALLAGPRRHIYHLEPAPPNRVIRGLHRYWPDELIRRG